MHVAGTPELVVLVLRGGGRNYSIPCFAVQDILHSFFSKPHPARNHRSVWPLYASGAQYARVWKMKLLCELGTMSLGLFAFCQKARIAIEGGRTSSNDRPQKCWFEQGGSINVSTQEDRIWHFRLRERSQGFHAPYTPSSPSLAPFRTRLSHSIRKSRRLHALASNTAFKSRTRRSRRIPQPMCIRSRISQHGSRLIARQGRCKARQEQTMLARQPSF